MGLFSKKHSDKENCESINKSNASSSNNTIDLLEKHEKGLLDDAAFLKSFGKAKILYTTPFGDHKDRGSRLFALPGPDKSGYLPVFSTAERMNEFYTKVGRTGFLTLEGTFTSFLNTTKDMNKNNAPIKLGVVIDPGYYGITVDASVLETVIKMTI